GGVPLLRGGDAGARRAAARSRVGGDAPTRSLLKRGVSGARARAEFFYLQSATRNSTGSPLVPAYCFLAHGDGWRWNAVVSRRGGAGSRPRLGRPRAQRAARRAAAGPRTGPPARAARRRAPAGPLLLRELRRGGQYPRGLRGGSGGRDRLHGTLQSALRVRRR